MLWIALRAWPADAVSISAARASLACHALRYTPRVSLSHDAVLMEVAASLRLFGGLRSLLVQLREQVTREDLVEHSDNLQAAAGPTSLQALARLRLQRPWRETVRIAAVDLPLATLDAAQSHLPLLKRLGCQRWQDLRCLPRQGVARRFGQDLLDALDQALGERPESHVWWQVPEAFTAHLQWPGGVEQAEGLLRAAECLLQHLRTWLVTRKLGVLGLELGWQSDSRRNAGDPRVLPLRLREASQDMGHVLRLLSEHLPVGRWDAPAQTVSLRSLETAPLAERSGTLLLEDQQRGESLEQLLERLEARLGPAQIRRWQPDDRHEPERMQQWLPASRLRHHESAPSTEFSARSRSIAPPGSLAGSKAGPGAGQGLALPAQWAQLLPTWLLSQPQPLRLQGDRPWYQGQLALLVGPQRLEVAGWMLADRGEDGDRRMQTPVLRDYFIARSARAGLLWIYRERRPRVQTAWFLHGIFA